MSLHDPTPPPRLRRPAALLVAAALAGARADAQFANPGAYVSPQRASETAGKNVLFFGNSFTISSQNPTVHTPVWGGARGVPELVRQIAIAAGHPAPFVKNVYHLNRGLDYHVNPANPSLGEIDETRLDGEAWDVVVLQGFSLRPTNHPYTGNLAKLKANAARLVAEVRSGTTGHALQSPDATFVLYQTWAREPGHWLYDTASTSTSGNNLPYATSAWPNGPIFDGLADLAAQVRTGYAETRRWIAANEPGVALALARAGDAWELAAATGGSGLGLWAADDYHAASPGDLLTALVLFGTIWDEPGTRALVDGGELDGVLAVLGVATPDARVLADAADATRLVPPVPAPLPFPRAASILVDLSDAAGSPGGPETLPVPGRRYNLLADPLAGAVTNAVDVDGRPTGVDVVVVDGFADETSGGATAAWIGANALSGSLYAESAQLDSFFVGLGFGYDDPVARLEVRGLDPDARYRFLFHGSRNSAAAARVGRYTIAGRAAELNAVHNLNLRAFLGGVAPDDEGTVPIEVTTDGSVPGFAYLGVLEIRPMRPTAARAPGPPRRR